MGHTDNVVPRRFRFILSPACLLPALLFCLTSDPVFAGANGVALIAAASPTASAKIDANGRTVTRVVFGQQGQRLGTFKQTAPGQWEEIPAAKNGARFQFAETGRDDWSVYLHDRSREVRLQLDLHRKQVLYSDARTPAPSPLYEILVATVGKSDDTSPAAPAESGEKPAKGTAAAAGIEVNGRTVTNVVFGQQGKRLGKYQQTGPARWEEIPTAESGTRFQFEETGRDDWSVYLHDRSRDVRIQLDLHRKQVLYSDTQSPSPRPLYEILKATAKPV